MKSNLLPIAREGWNYLIGSIVLLLIFKFLNFEFLQFLAFLAMMFFVYVFRNPERQNMLYQENSIVSPVDGTVVSIEELHDEENSGYKVEIEGTYLNVSLLRVPFTSSLEHIEIQRGARLSATSPLSKNINENAELIFADKRSSNKIKIIHKLKQSFETIDIDIIKAQDLLQGTRYGLMINGITTIYLPTNFRLNVGLGSELIASETLIGYFTNESKK
ncbi:MAG: phosphatidylserine decarboxylase [Sulfurimonas sp. RIFCSPHIGHO2_12_FULL_36_9]|uniref:phosphatidylserine decarboxylase n=1 Tax=Sulfurimonas sp. RIFCSPLOWO2_12_36_12 TaxID=1802253 RepID=UPI0008B38A45|nr:phosphatidylserine decarboxylase [Sulfurimonas sp. RIFCSPLOWO2_12_36_12]OHD96955.1 MAG: phosphatidylserine decarboxylase [Sulfurimonas sp. RIFCSPLOWO2_02_FULL_36_28]OHD99232.1 MAG: phosphatidylserine decarboxylase [Sulfurimonas sp. RIFCSPHIGHO2_12_FULL_36_9]OHE03055.1 MAG: phosphatidylserine decarboxylase [Sulfurimonas sp. RIFCSPLOWO2_12_36_12]OHE08232.1 MAG: phosphatidylserine decarboxylase [Sulfurimonas sp. RIFCSPLOWO2_12_FULL_36_74]